MTTSQQERYKERYKEKLTPWDIGRADFNLVEIVTQSILEQGRVLDVGCGSGHNSIWLAEQGFTVTGIDVSELAVERAKENASGAGIQANFLVMDFFEKEVSGRPFKLVFDRGCFHSYENESERRAFSEKVAGHLEEGGFWLSLIGSSDDPIKRPGPPRRSARDIVEAVEPFFKILLLKASHFDSNVQNPPQAWACLMQKR
ncbi:MAG TPA: methyltransferase domain-containing protein [Thermodesulfobacteriota bacterium]|nr:methyltransferase domain-containing protein [Thermodesulfobacteriota bacterium]